MPDYQDYTSLIECFRCGSLLHDPKAGVPCPECGRPYHPADRYATRPRSAAGIRRTVLWGVGAVIVGLVGLTLNGGF